MLKKFATVVICGLILQTTALAANIHSINYDLETSTVCIDGSISQAFQSVTLEILKKGIKSEDITNWDVSKLYRIDETQTDSNGNFRFEFEMNTETGDYITRIHTNTIDEDCIVYINHTEFTEAFEEINDANNEETILNIIQTKGNLLGFSDDYYKYFNNQQKNSIAKQILDKKNNNPGKEFLNVNELLSVYNTSTAIVALSSSNTNSNLNSLSIIESNIEILGIKDSNAYDTYKNFTNSEKATLAFKLSNEEYSDKDDFVKKFTSAVVLLEIKNTENYINLYSLLSDNNNVLQMDFTEYEKLDSYKKSLVLRKLAGVSCTNLNELKTAFYNAVKEAKNTTATQNTSGGGGGGAISVQVPSLTNIDKNGGIGKSYPFSDVESSNWAASSILSLYEKGILHGKGDGNFCPNDAVKREEFIKMIISGIGSNSSDTKTPFNDVDVDMWYASYVAQAYSMGIVNGINDKNFGIGKDITREDLVVMLYRLVNKIGIELPSNNKKTFKDTESISAYAKDAVTALSSAGIINGNENGEFEPKKSATRAETAKILDEFLMYVN